MKQGFLVIDKPQGWTSHDVVAKMRGVLGIRKIGHLGTLDPISTGVLVLAVGREATKQVAQLMGVEKEYDVELELGKVSDTYDAEGAVRETGFDLSGLRAEEIVAALERFWGETQQVPPAYSAKKVGGKRAYQLARAGKPVELQARTVRMQGSDVEVELPFVRFHVEVSSGTYVRSLVHDLGEVLGCGAVMTALRRTRVGDFRLDQAVSIQEVLENPDLPLLS